MRNYLTEIQCQAMLTHNSKDIQLTTANVVHTFEDEDALDGFLLNQEAIDIWHITDKRNVGTIRIYYQRKNGWGEVQKHTTKQALYKEISLDTGGAWEMQHFNHDVEKGAGPIFVLDNSGWIYSDFKEFDSSEAFQAGIAAKEANQSFMKKLFWGAMTGAVVLGSAYTAYRYVTSFDSENIENGINPNFENRNLLAIQSYENRDEATPSLKLMATFSTAASSMAPLCSIPPCYQPQVLYLTGQLGFEIVSVSDPANPTLLGSSSGNYYVSGESSFNQLAVSGVTSDCPANNAYVAGGQRGLYVFSTEDSTHPSLLSEDNAIPGGVYKLAYFFADAALQDMLLTIPFSPTETKIQLVSINNPSTPELKGSYVNSDSISNLRSKFVISYLPDGGNIVYLPEQNSIEIISLNDINNPILISSYPISAVSPLFSMALSDDGNTLFAVGDGFEIIDVSIPSNPALLFAHNYTGGIDIVVSNHTAYIISDGSILAYDVSDPRNPKKVMDYRGNDSTSIDSMRISGDIIYGLAEQQALYVFKIISEMTGNSLASSSSSESSTFKPLYLTLPFLVGSGAGVFLLTTAFAFVCYQYHRNKRQRLASTGGKLEKEAANEANPLLKEAGKEVVKSEDQASYGALTGSDGDRSPALFSGVPSGEVSVNATIEENEKKTSALLG